MSFSSTSAAESCCSEAQQRFYPAKYYFYVNYMFDNEDK